MKDYLMNNVENNSGKREDARSVQFLPLPQSFGNSSGAFVYQIVMSD